MSKIKYLLLLLIFSSCLDPIQLEVTAEDQETTIIQGKIVKGEVQSLAQVTITNLFDFTPESRQPILVRSVELFEEGGGKVELERSGVQTYIAFLDNDDPNFPIEYGNKYWIRVVTLKDKKFVSEPEVLLRVPDIRDISFSYNELDGEVDIALSTDILDNTDGKKSRLRFNTKHWYRVTDCLEQECYVYNRVSINKIKTLNGNEISENEINLPEVAEILVNSFFAEGAYIEVETESLSDNSFTYWDEMSSLVLRSGNMFEEPVGIHLTNLRTENAEDSDKIHGFFYATEKVIKRIYIGPEDVGSPTFACPPAKPKEPNCLPCCNCLGVTNSSLVKPNFWIK